MVMDSACVATADAPSVTWAVKLKVPTVVGVPEMMPPRSTLRPGGRPDATDHVHGSWPPLAVSATAYGAATLPAGRLVVVIVSGGLSADAGAASTAPDPRATSVAVRSASSRARLAGADAVRACPAIGRPLLL